jgi:hypothetical protein
MSSILVNVTSNWKIMETVIDVHTKTSKDYPYEKYKYWENFTIKQDGTREDEETRQQKFNDICMRVEQTLIESITNIALN